MSNARILVVEDEPDVCAALHSFLGRRGYEVSTTSSGCEALKLIRVISPGLVLLDINLDGISGVDMLKELRRNDSRTRVIVITGQSLEEEMVRELKSLEVLGVLHKPVALAHLEQCVAGILGRDAGGSPVFVDPGPFFKQDHGPDLHKVANLLGAVRSACESFVLDEEEGFHQAQSADEIRMMSARVMRGVIENVDRISACIGGNNGQ